MEFFVWVVVFCVFAVLVALRKARILAATEKAIKGHLDHLVDFSATQEVTGSDGRTGLALDEQRKKICLISTGKQKGELGVASRVLSYRDVLSSEIFEDGATITRTVRSSQIGGALIGGLVFGGVGAIVGSLSGKKEASSGKVKKLELRLTVNDTKNPLHDITFLDVAATKNGSAYKQAIARARHWHGVVEVTCRISSDQSLLENGADRTC